MKFLAVVTPPSIYHTHLHEYFSFFSFVRMMRIMRKWDSLGAVGNIYSIPVFARTEASTEANPQMEVKL